MKKQLRCRDLGHECNFVARDESEDEILKVFAEHMAAAHKISLKNKKEHDKAKSLIRKVA